MPDKIAVHIYTFTVCTPTPFSSISKFGSPISDEFMHYTSPWVIKLVKCNQNGTFTNRKEYTSKNGFCFSYNYMIIIIISVIRRSPFSLDLCMYCTLLVPLHFNRYSNRNCMRVSCNSISLTKHHKCVHLVRFAILAIAPYFWQLLITRFTNCLTGMWMNKILTELNSDQIVKTHCDQITQEKQPSIWKYLSSYSESRLIAMWIKMKWNFCERDFAINAIFRCETFTKICFMSKGEKQCRQLCLFFNVV